MSYNLKININILNINGRKSTIKIATDDFRK